MSTAGPLRLLLSTLLLLCISLTTLAGNRASASPIIDSPIFPASPDVVVDFGVNLFPPGTLIDTQFASSGVVFGPNYSYFTTLLPQPPATFLGFLQPPEASAPPGPILFTTDVTAAGFSFRTRFTGQTTFEAYLDGALVESFVALTDTNSTTARFYGFENIVFDEIRIAPPTGGFFLDNLQFNIVPEPSTALLFGLGLLGLGMGRRNVTRG